MSVKKEFIVIHEPHGVAYSGGYLYKGDGSVYAIDIKSVNINNPVFLKEEHQVIGSIGDAHLINKDDKQVHFTSKIFNYDSEAERVAHQLERGLRWQASVGIEAEESIENFTGEVNGQHLENVTLLRGGAFKEVSLVIHPADYDSKVRKETFTFTVAGSGDDDKKEKQKENTEGVKVSDKKPEFMSKAEWMEFACACGGTARSTPRELEKKFQEGADAIEALAVAEEAVAEVKKTEEELKAELAELTAKVEELNEQLKEYTDAEGVIIDQEIEEFAKATGKEFSAEEKANFKKFPAMFNQLKSLVGETSGFKPKMREEFDGKKKSVSASKVGAAGLMTKAKELVANKTLSTISQALVHVAKENERK